MPLYKPFSDPGAQARVLLRGAKAPAGSEAAVFVLSDGARHTLCQRFGFCDDRLERALRRLGARGVTALSALPHGPVDADARELLRRVREGTLPWLARPCPRRGRQAAQAAGHAMWLGALHGGTDERAAQPPATFPGHAAVVQCPMRKAELMRQGAFDAVYTARELALLLLEAGFVPADGAGVPARGAGAPACREASGWLEAVVARACWLCGEPAPALRFAPMQGMPGVETATLGLLGRQVTAARVRGAANARRVLERWPDVPFDVVEVLGCAGGC